MNNQPIFSTNKNTYNNAYLNWLMSDDMTENLYQMGKAYGDGAIQLLNICLSQNNDYRADALIFPIMHGINQHIELCIKSIIRQIEILDNSTISNIKTHDIKQLLSQMESKIREHNNGKTKGLKKHLQPVQSYIDELYVYIEEDSGHPHVEYSRYPMDVNENPFFYVVMHKNVTVDLHILNDKFRCIMNSLESLHYCYYEELELKGEMLYEMRLAKCQWEEDDDNA